MRNKGQSGFTIIEVMLVLAVSALLISTTVIGTYRMVFDARFKDVMMNVASWLQTQYEEVRSGVIPSCDNGDINTSDRVLLGRVIRFSDNGTNSIIETYPVAGNASYGDGDYRAPDYDIYRFDRGVGLSDIGRFSGVHVITECKMTRELDWQARATNLFTYSDNDSDPVSFNTILLLHSSENMNLKSYFGNTNGEPDLISKVSSVFTSLPAFIVQSTSFKERGAVVIKNGDSEMFQSLGVVCIDPGANSTNVWGARGLEASGARGTLTGDSLKNIVGTVRGKCNE